MIQMRWTELDLLISCMEICLQYDENDFYTFPSYNINVGRIRIYWKGDIFYFAYNRKD